MGPEAQNHRPGPLQSGERSASSLGFHPGEEPLGLPRIGDPRRLHPTSLGVEHAPANLGELPNSVGIGVDDEGHVTVGAETQHLG